MGCLRRTPQGRWGIADTLGHTPPRPTYESTDVGFGAAEAEGTEDRTMAEESKPVEVSRRIGAPASLIFEILANPQRHKDFDGSGMLRGAVLDRPLSGVGDTFTMKMHRLGDDYLMLNYVVEFESDRRIFGSRLPEILPGLRVMIHPKSAFLRATGGATSSLQTVTTPPSSPRSLTTGHCRRTSSVTAGRGSTGPIRCSNPWRPAWRGSRRSAPRRPAAGVA